MENPKRRKRMKRVLSNTILVLSFLLVSTFPTQSFAALEERDSYRGIGSITYDTTTGLEWLDVDLSINRSYDDVSSQFGEEGDFEGFRHATIEEVEDLFFAAGITIIGGWGDDTDYMEACEAFALLLGPTSWWLELPAVSGISGSPFEVLWRGAATSPSSRDGHIVYLTSINPSGGFSGTWYSPKMGHWLVRETVVDPEVMLQQLSEIVFSLNIKQGISNSFDAKLSSALKALDDLNENNDVAAINSLNAFMNAVDAQRGKELTETEADELISKVQAIIDVLSQ